MTFLCLLPAVLSLLTLGAHFFRAGNRAGVAATLALLVLLAIRRPFSARVVPLSLLLGAGVWIATAWRIGAWRMDHGQPWRRMAFILGGVALFTAASALPFRSARVKRWFRLEAAP